MCELAAGFLQVGDSACCRNRSATGNEGRVTSSAPESATLVFGCHLDMAKICILTQDEIDRYMNNSDELSEDGLEYSDDDVFYQIVCHLMKIRIATVKISVGSQNTIQNIKKIR
ncbi:uncharacterized protein TNCV_849271 [Trichonephila clavipes]|uniref:Uncharacterized protein n=1 Tax=Trichonephila clavipes TaxID=2585209 RepID=A0A8X6RUI7_TRICX|nr:uncharacterized protein TNCV_849271 [Trichonephila clavipes]